MRRLSLTVATSLVLFGLVATPRPASAGGEPHPLIRRAVNALHGAVTDLQNAAHDYCGHRLEALQASNSALAQLQQALQCDSGRKSRSAGADIEPDPESAAAGAERHPNIYRAINALGAAEGDLQNAAHDYCGHRVEALGAVQNVLSQLKLAIQCDKK